jgi:methionyl-tRNA synthetase
VSTRALCVSDAQGVRLLTQPAPTSIDPCRARASKAPGAIPYNPAMTPYYITTPIYYVNDRPHIGHCYTTLVCDVAARFQRRVLGQPDDAPEADRPVFFLTGTDEHAEKVVRAAADHDMTPLAWADRNAAEFKVAFKAMNFSNDDFVRTTESRHTTRAAAYIKRLVDSGDIELGDYEGWYDASQEEYVTETVAKENDYASPVTGKPLERRTEQNYFFRLDKYTDRLMEAYELGRTGRPGGVRVLPEARLNEVLGRVRQGLQKVPVSRRIKPEDADWGIRMPGDDEHRIYVWIEALCNYLTTVDTPERRRFWPATVHVMAKDILWFHAVVWPAMLMALGEEPPRTIYAHAYWIREGRKMSKSLGNFIEIELLQAYAERYSLDALRWYLMTQGPLGSTDADFSHAHFVEVYNADLANGIGNALSRVGNMIVKYFDGKVPDPKGVTKLHGRDWPRMVTDEVKESIYRAEQFDVAGAVRQGIELAKRVDGYIGDTRPFSLAKEIAGDTDPKRDELAAILYHCAEALRIATHLLAPALPEKMIQAWRTWNCLPASGATMLDLAEWGGPHSLRPGTTIAKGEALFMRADLEEAPPTAS